MQLILEILQYLSVRPIVVSWTTTEEYVWYSLNKDSLITDFAYRTLNKMAAILQMTFSKHIFLNEKFSIVIKIWVKFVSQGPTNNESAQVKMMAWNLTEPNWTNGDQFSQ